MRILIALSATEWCGEIVKTAALRPWPAGSQFLLLHVLDPFPFGKAPATLQRAIQAAETQLQNVCNPLCSRGWSVERAVVVGNPRKAIIKTAESWESDLILVGSNEMTPLMRFFLGSTARAVLREAPCSVEIVRPALADQNAAKRGMKILVPVDGSECSTAALRAVAERPWPANSTIKVVSLPDPFMPIDSFPYLQRNEIEDQNEAALNGARNHVIVAADMLKKRGLQTMEETPVPRNTNAREIVSEAEHWNAGLVVVGSHGRRGFDRIMLGSVSEHVALHAPCSVEVIRNSQGPEKTEQTKTAQGGEP
jgi:nucleotide-binding universal stress UspA family protein